MRFGGEYDGEDCWLVWGRWEANLKRALNGRPGLAALQRLEAALLALPTKRLITGNIVSNGDVCALGALALQEQIKYGSADPWADLALNYGYLQDEDTADVEEVSVEIGVRHGMSRTLATYIAATNDEDWPAKTPEERYTWMLNRVRHWITESRAARPAGAGAGEGE